MLYYTIFNFSITYYTILYYTILYYTILYYTILYYTILYYTILYYTILYYTILYYTILYDTIQYVHMSLRPEAVKIVTILTIRDRDSRRRDARAVLAHREASATETLLCELAERPFIRVSQGRVGPVRREPAVVGNKMEPKLRALHGSAAGSGSLRLDAGSNPSCTAREHIMPLTPYATQ